MNDPQLHMNWTTVFAFLGAVGSMLISIVLFAAKSRLVPIEVAIASVSSKVDDVLEKINSLTSRIDRLEVRVAEHENHDQQHRNWVREELAQVRERQRELGADIQAMQRRLPQASASN